MIHLKPSRYATVSTLNYLHRLRRCDFTKHGKWYHPLQPCFTQPSQKKTGRSHCSLNTEVLVASYSNRFTCAPRGFAERCHRFARSPCCPPHASDTISAPARARGPAHRLASERSQMACARPSQALDASCRNRFTRAPRGFAERCHCFGRSPCCPPHASDTVSAPARARGPHRRLPSERSVPNARVRPKYRTKARIRLSRPWHQADCSRTRPAVSGPRHTLRI